MARWYGACAVWYPAPTPSRIHRLRPRKSSLGARARAVVHVILEEARVADQAAWVLGCPRAALRAVAIRVPAAPVLARRGADEWQRVAWVAGAELTRLAGGVAGGGRARHALRSAPSDKAAGAHHASLVYGRQHEALGGLFIELARQCDVAVARKRHRALALVPVGRVPVGAPVLKVEHAHALSLIHISEPTRRS
eukprot:122509-Prymnesium_polylepis.2